MKLIAIVISLACLSQGAFAEEEATPSPTPVIRHHLARPGSVRRMEQVSRQRALAPESQSRAETREQKKASRRSTAAVRAQERQAALSREKAEREVAAQNRAQASKATTQPTSDLMTRMRFSEEEIAAQKAREQSTKPKVRETDQTPKAEEPQAPARP